MQLRVARHTERLEEVVAFYRDGIGLGEIGGFRDHDGYDGVFLAVPGTGAHLELTAGGGHGASRRRSGRSCQPVLGSARGDVPGPGRLPSRPRARALGVVAARASGSPPEDEIADVASAQLSEIASVVAVADPSFCLAMRAAKRVVVRGRSA